MATSSEYFCIFVVLNNKDMTKFDNIILIFLLLTLIGCGSNDEPYNEPYKVSASCILVNEASEVKGSEAKNGDAYNFYSSYKKSITDIIAKYNNYAFPNSSSSSPQELADKYKEQIIADFNKIQKELDNASVHKCHFNFEISISTKVIDGNKEFQSMETLTIVYAPDFSDISRFTVRIDLSSYALWGNFGVSEIGGYRIFDKENSIPESFPYNENSYTGFSGVILIMGYDRSTGYPQPLAYEATCPIEKSFLNLLSIDANSLDAVCSLCGSHYDVLVGGGGPKAGPAISKMVGLIQYKASPRMQGGYFIYN